MQTADVPEIYLRPFLFSVLSTARLFSCDNVILLSRRIGYFVLDNVSQKLRDPLEKESAMTVAIVIKNCHIVIFF